MTEDTFSLIEAYVSGRMTPAERDAFEQQLASEPELREQTEVMKKLVTGIRVAGREQLRRQIFPPQTIPFMIRLNKKWALTIPFIFFATAIILYNLIFPLENSRLFDTYYARIDSINLTTPRGEAADLNLKQEAFIQYKTGNYDSAKAILSGVESPDDESALISGLVSIELKDWEGAKSELRKALNGSRKNAATANWYLALIQVRTKDYAAAKASLKELTDQPNAYQESARRLLQELK